MSLLLFGVGIFSFVLESHAKECQLHSARDCPASAFEEGVFTDIVPSGKYGENTKCLGGGKYSFQVRRGDAQKLLIHFQGGGACWSRTSLSADVCLKEVRRVGAHGAFDASKPGNPWADHSVVIVNYCSGDLHGGKESFMFWGFKKAVGLENAQVAVDYALANFAKVRELTVSGSETGALGAQLWSRYILERLQDQLDASTVIIDSFAGIAQGQAFPRIMKIFNTMGICKSSVLLSIFEQTACKDERLSLSSVFGRTIRNNHKTRFVALNSKFDARQITFENLLKDKGAPDTTAKVFNKELYSLLESWIKNANFYSYIVPQGENRFLEKDTLFVETPDHSGEVGPKMIEWLGRLVSPGRPALRRTVCWDGRSALLPVTESSCSDKLRGFEKPKLALGKFHN